MRAADIMTKNVCVIRPEVTLKEAATMLLRRHVRGLPVVDAAGALVGIITEADLIAAGSAPDPRRDGGTGLPCLPRTVADVMSTRVIAATADAHLADIARIMLSAHLTRVPVLDDRGRLVGLISRRDLLRLLTRSDDEIMADVQELADEYGAGTTVAVVDGEVTLSGAVPALDALGTAIRAVPGVVAVRVDCSAA
jgi:CBS domain-containing protein